MIDTLHGASSSAVIYSIAETAKANRLKPYEYFEFLLTEIPKHMDDKIAWLQKQPDVFKVLRVLPFTLQARLTAYMR